ncbi:uncharacterized protein LOC128167390 [Crassostrea angulata]|uniref:uncharacterized protein LOC128167390 n=1 Tax=Magallana angulata TaxID=2784310 RepID=UPI0022B1E296|nr:uncharacterized protein LOC128167390 [Crassostrea angulata]
MAKEQPVRSNKRKSKSKKVRKEKVDDVDPIGLLRKLTNTAKSKTVFDDHETSGTQVGVSRWCLQNQAPSTMSCYNGDLPEWFEDLTDDNVSAFKDLFDMLDAAHTGTLNADDLYEGLRRVDSEITREEVEAALKKLDKDGNGEINFDEFLFHMTQGDLLEGLGGDEKKRKGTFSRRQRLFFTAITQFSLKRSLGEDFRYITKRQPHVLSHYTAGLRLIGLTDRQLALQMKKMQEKSANTDSPYAKPLQFVSQTSGMKTMHRPGQYRNKDFSSKYKLNTAPVSAVLPTRSKPEHPHPGPIHPGPVNADSVRTEKEIPLKSFPTRIMRESIVNKLPGGDLINKIKTQIMNKAITSKQLNLALGIRPSPIENAKVEKQPKANGSRKKTHSHCGWTVPKIEQVFVPLPVLKIKYPKNRPTIDDLPNIREQARKAMGEFYHNMQKACVVHSLEHWEKLYADTIRPKKMLENFRTVYRAYSPHKEEEAFVVCPWMPGPCVYNRRRILPMNHQTIWSPRSCGSPNLVRNLSTPDAELRCASSLN